jgi:HSP20 family protein
VTAIKVTAARQIPGGSGHLASRSWAGAVHGRVLRKGVRRPGLPFPPARPRSAASSAWRRQVFLGETLDADRVAADYAAGVLTLTIPVSEAAKPRNIQVTSSDQKQAVNA